MSEALDAAPEKMLPPPACQRMTPTDLHEMAGFLIERVQGRYPDKNPRAIMGWLGGCVASNEYFFVRCGAAVALAQVMQDFLEPMWVQEVFVFVPQFSEPEGRALYSDIAQWATNKGAARIVVGLFTDVTHPHLMKEIGTMRRIPGYSAILPLE